MKYLMAGALALALATGAQADHHGRGAEQLNGFPGVYDIGLGVATFTHDGYWVITSRDARVAVTVMTYTIEDGVMTIGTLSPPPFLPEEAQACLRDNGATYAIVDKEGGFDLKPIEDPCPQRAGLLQRFSFTDYQRPE